MIMPKTQLHDLKNLDTWAGIKKKKNDNGEAEAVDCELDKENVCLYYTKKRQADEGQISQMIIFLTRHVPDDILTQFDNAHQNYLN